MLHQSKTPYNSSPDTRQPLISSNSLCVVISNQRIEDNDETRAIIRRRDRTVHCHRMQQEYKFLGPCARYGRQCVLCVNVLYSGMHERKTSTDVSGYYRISESSGENCLMTNGSQYDISFSKDGYQDDSRNVSVCDDTTADIKLTKNQNTDSNDNQ